MRGGTGAGARLLDQFPKAGVILQLFVLASGEAGAIEEILEGILAENAVDDDAEGMAFEVDAIITEAIAHEGPGIAGQMPEMGLVQLEFLRQAAKLPEDLELKILGHLRQLGRARRIEDDLERLHFCGEV